MTDKVHEIVICMGSSCFSRGNKATVKMIQNYLKMRRLEDEVLLKGAHCMGLCDQGPVIKVNNDEVVQLTPYNLEEILDQKLGLTEEE